MRIRAKPKSFLDAARRDWQFDVFAWLLRHSGGYPKFLDTTLVLPTEEHFPDRGLKGHAAVAALFRRARDHAGMAEWPCGVEPETDPPRATDPASAGLRMFTYKRRNGLEPVSLVAGFGCDLARFLLETFEQTYPGGDAVREPVTEMAAVFMGFGVFIANSAVRQTRYQLCEGELAHALAMFCILIQAPLDTVDKHLNPHLRKYLRLAARDLAQHEMKFQKLRNTIPIIPERMADAVSPPQAG